MFVVLSLSAALNMNLFYGLGRGVGWAIPRTLTIVDTSVLLSLLHVATLVRFVRLLARAATADAETRAPSSAAA